MRVLIDINHPAHVHLFRCAAKDWANEGHEILFTATDKDVVCSLLKAYNLPHEVVYVRQHGKLNLAKELVLRTGKMGAVMHRFKPDVVLSTGSPTAAWASFALRIPHFAFDDTEDSIGQAWLYRPFVSAVCVPECFMRSFGSKEIRYPGYHELAYLHPNRFNPNPAQIEPLRSNERFFIVRFITWDAAHDDHQTGFSQEGKQDLLDLLSQHGKVVLSVENTPPTLLNREGEGQELPADSMHHLLAYAGLYVGEGVTACSESAVLGTPAVLVNTRTLGYIQEQQDRFNLSYHFTDEAPALEKIARMLEQEDLKNVWYCRQQVMLGEKTDVTAWIKKLVKDRVGAKHGSPS
jgi:uncharacterized protein